LTWATKAQADAEKAQQMMRASHPLVVLILERRVGGPRSSYWSLSGGWLASISLKSAGLNLVWRRRARLPLISR
jgi:hypothetical protein